MPLSLAIQDPMFAEQSEVLDRRNQFVRALASAILLENYSFETLWSIANRVCDRHCSPRLESRRYDLDPPERTALSA